MSYYIHITTACNMSCPHCCFNYGNGKTGKHMPIDMFRHIMKRIYNEGEIVTIGGGEICLYPDFEQMLGVLASYRFEMPPLIVTNGSITERALLLNRLGEAEIINCELSQDAFHDWIEPKVVAAFKARNAIRNVARHNSLISAGRAKNLDSFYDLQKICPCDSVQFYPTGVVKWCGCPRSPVITRNVMSDWKLPENYCDCYKSAEPLEKLRLDKLKTGL